MHQKHPFNVIYTLLFKHKFEELPHQIGFIISPKNSWDQKVFRENLPWKHQLGANATSGCSFWKTQTSHENRHHHRKVAWEDSEHHEFREPKFSPLFLGGSMESWESERARDPMLRKTPRSNALIEGLIEGPSTLIRPAIRAVFLGGGGIAGVPLRFP